MSGQSGTTLSHAISTGSTLIVEPKRVVRDYQVKPARYTQSIRYLLEETRELVRDLQDLAHQGDHLVLQHRRSKARLRNAVIP